MGDIENSRIILVMLNPGYAGNEYVEHSSPISRKAILNTIMQKFEGPLAVSRYMYINPEFSNTAGYKYLCAERHTGGEKGTLRDCIEEISRRKDISIDKAIAFFSNNICMIEPISYHSEKFGGMTQCLKGLPSFLEVKKYLKEKVKDDQNKIFFVRRQGLFTETEFNKPNVERFVNGEYHSGYFTLEKHGKTLLEYLDKLYSS